jgi:hypothetical protein
MIQLSVVLGCVGRVSVVAASELAIEWSAPASCPDRADMVSRVARLLGDAVEANLTATADVTRSAAKFQARVRFTSADGFAERVLENTHCEILADSVALVIALAASSSGSPREDRDAERDSGVAVALSAHGTALAGPLPQVGFGAGAAVALEGLAALRLELNGSYYAQQSTTFDQTNVGANFRLVRLGARGCRVWIVGAFALAPCLGAQLFRIEGEGFGGHTYRSAATFMWGPALGVFGRLLLWPSFGVYLAADGFVPIIRQRFVYSDAGALHRPFAVGFQLFIGPEVRF